MRKILVLVFVFLLFPIVVFADDCAVLTTFSEIDKNNKNIVNIKVDIKNNPGLTAWMFEIDYDDNAFEYVEESLILSDVFSKGTILENADEPGKLVVSWFNFGDIDSDGNLISFSLLVKDSAESGEYKLVLKCDDSNFVNFDEELVPVVSEDTSVEISTNKIFEETKLLKEHNILINPSDEYTLKANEDNLIWVSSDESVAIVDNGKIVPVGEGTVTIEAHSQDGTKQDVCLVNVSKDNPTTFEKLFTNSLFVSLIVAVPLVIILIVVIINKKRRTA